MRFIESNDFYCRIYSLLGGCYDGGRIRLRKDPFFMMGAKETGYGKGVLWGFMGSLLKHNNIFCVLRWLLAIFLISWKGKVLSFRSGF